MHLDLDAFFCSVEESLNPELKTKPVVIGADPKEGKGRGVVSTCSYSARKFGIHSAMPISQAYKLCKDAIFLRPQYHLYSQYSKGIMHIVKNYANKFQQTGMDEAFLDVSDSANDFSDAKIIAIKIKTEILEKYKITCSIGIANNKLVAKIASDLQKPDAIVIVDDAKALLAPLPIRKLYGIGKKTEPKIRELGIETIGDLAEFDKEKLIKRFGTYGLYLSLSAQGQGSDFIGYDRGRSSISNERTFFEDTSDFAKVGYTIRKLCKEIHETLITEQFTYRTISIKIRLQDFSTFSRSHSIMFASLSKEIIYQSALDLCTEFEGKVIRLIGVRVSNLAKVQGQRTIHDYMARDQSESIAI